VELIQHIAAIHLFKDLPDQHLNDLAMIVADQVFSKGQLSSLLGTVPETLSRILTKMSNLGLIRSEGLRGIQILDRESLEDLADGETHLH
jgi:CRP-like cAMP-binding protein